MSNQDVRRLPKELIKIGVPTSYPIYDAQGNLLMQAGVVVETENQLEKLYERGLYLDLKTSDQLKLRRGDASNFVSDAVKKEAEEPEGEMLVPLPFKNLKVGEVLQISPLTDPTGATKYMTKYIGGVDKKSIICAIPYVDEKVAFIKEGTGFSVRLFSGKNVYRFNTTAEVVFSRPYPHMHLKFPREVYANRLRKNQRVSANIIVAILNKTPGLNEGFKTAGRIVDLSLGGSQIEAYSSAGAVGESIECTFKIELDGGEAVVVIPGILRAINKASQTEGKTLYRHGVQFGEIQFQDKIIMQSYIFQALTGEKLEEL